MPRSWHFAYVAPPRTSQRSDWSRAWTTNIQLLVTFQAINYMFQSLGVKCVPYLPEIIPTYLATIESCDPNIREVSSYQWRNQPKILVDQIFYFTRATIFCLGRVSQSMLEILVVWPPWPMVLTSRASHRLRASTLKLGVRANHLNKTV